MKSKGTSSSFASLTFTNGSCNLIGSSTVSITIGPQFHVKIVGNGSSILIRQLFCSVL